MEKGWKDISFLEKAEAKTVERGEVSKQRIGRPKKPNMKQFTIRMEASVHSSLKDYAARTGEGTSSIIQRVVREYLKRSS